MEKKTFVVVGAAGVTGRAVIENLHARGHHVRPVSRSAGVSIDDPTALDQAFTGADGAFLLIPFDMAAPDLHARETEIGSKLAAAVAAARVRRVVLLSGLAAQGSGIGASMMEARLDALDIPELVHLRGCFFMENLLNLGFVDQAQSGTYGTMFRADLATPMVAARDVGKKAADLLTRAPFREPRTREILGPRDYTMAEATRILGAAIGKPDVKYTQVSYDDAHRAMVSSGLSKSFADAVTETARSFNEGPRWSKEARSPENTTETTLEEFASSTLGAKARQAAPGAKTSR